MIAQRWEASTGIADCKFLLRGQSQIQLKVILENLSKTFPLPRGQNVHAVQKLNLTIGDKELLALVGPTGCGKTTVLRLIAGLEEPADGKIFVGEQCVNDIPAKDRDVAMVFQNGALYPHMTVRENIAFGLKLRKFSCEQIAKRVNEAAQMLGIIDFLDRKPESLSGGQRQRVALGRAIVRHPKIFLLDEPLSNLDPITRKRLRREIAQLQATLAVPMIYVTHDPHEALTLGQRIAVMCDGQLQQCDIPDEIRNRPANDFVRELFAPD
jgi:multiple sugar transport system ATP-binding protein